MSAGGEGKNKKNFEQKILEAEYEIEQATSQLFQLERILEGICQEVRSLLGFDFAGISLVSRERNTIEAVCGTGITQQLAGRAKHYLEQDEDLRDIQADIVQTHRTEIISGLDKRFDRWIYEEFKHDQIVRVYMPILLIQDKDGTIIDNWVEQYPRENIFTREEPEGQCKVLERPTFPSNFEITAIGTLEAGYEDRNRVIEDQTVLELARLVSRKALDIWKAQLPWVLEIIAEKARQIMKADSASLHFLYEPLKSCYIYQAFSGNVGWHFLRSCPPRPEGIGREAIREGRCKYIPDPSQGHSPLEIQKLNPKAFASGAKALAAFPLKVDYQDGNPHREGVLYVQYRKEHQFTEEELRWGQVFANRAADAMRHAILYEQRRDHEQLLTTLHSVAQFLADIPQKDVLLHRIAWNALNILAADVVTIYKYTQTEREFDLPPKIAGRLRAGSRTEGGHDRQHNVPSLFVECGENSYVSRVSENEIFREAPFSMRQEILAVAGILLKVGEEIVGVMFINYRRFHNFTPEEVKIIETLASSAAIAIKNQRWLAARNEIDRKIITTLNREELLNLIVEQAVVLTGANLGTIRLVDPDSGGQMLVTAAKYPRDTEIAPSRIYTSINEGITGWVARERRSALVDDVESEEWREYYQASFPSVRSELCVQLLDKNGRLLGVLNVENRRSQAFNRKDQQMLEALSDQAVIGIQNLENKDQLVKIEAMATIGQLTSSLLHKINNELGLIKIWVRKIIRRDSIGRADSIDKLHKIVTILEKFMLGFSRLKGSTQAQSEPVTIVQTISDTIDGLNIPNCIRQTIDSDSLHNLPKVFGNIQQVRDIFDNVLQNAVDSMPDGGELSVSGRTFERDRKVWVEVNIRDTGFGITEENLENIFQLGFTTKKNQTGMGWGLWLTNFSVERLGGYLSVNSQLDQGSTFSIIFPAEN
jgi:GAF domain-containing protein